MREAPKPRSPSSAASLRRRLAVPRQREDARAGLQMAHDAFQRAAMQADRRHVLQRPAEPRGGQAEGRRLRQAERLVGGNGAQQHVADAVVERIAARQHARPAGRDASRFPASRRRSGSARRAAGRVISASARPRWRLPPTTSSAAATSRARHRREAVEAVLADADDGQPALPCIGSRHRPWPPCAFSSSAARRKPRRWRAALAGDRALRRRCCRWPAAPPHPQPQPIADRIGGFGGADGLADFLRDEAIDAVIDATHPYRRRRCPRNAVAACARDRRAARLARARPPGSAAAGDRWRGRADCRRRGRCARRRTPRRVFLSLGRQELHAFAAAPQHHYVARADRAAASARCRPTCVVLGARAVRRDGRAAPAAERAASTSWSRKNSGGSGDLRQDRGRARARPAGRHDRAARTSRPATS